MAHLIDKDALIAEIGKRIKNLYPKGGQGVVVTKILKAHYEDLLSFLNALEVKEVDLESNDAMNTEVDDSNISCNSTSCSVHTTCKYFNPEKESNVKHCFGGVPMQLKQRKESAVKEVDLKKHVKSYIKDNFTITDEVSQIPEEYRIYSMQEDDMRAFAKHFFELGLKVNNEKEK